MKCLLIAASAALLVAGLSACSDNDSGTNANSARTAFDGAKTTTVAVDVDYFVENLPVVAGNVVTTVNNARHQGLENTPPGDVYDVGSYYDSMTSECKTKITRSGFRQDFIDRVVPLIANQQPERVTATVEGTHGLARVEQVSGTTVVMKFDLAGTLEEHACNDDGTIDITAE